MRLVKFLIDTLYTCLISIVGSCRFHYSHGLSCEVSSHRSTVNGERKIYRNVQHNKFSSYQEFFHLASSHGPVAVSLNHASTDPYDALVVWLEEEVNSKEKKACMRDVTNSVEMHRGWKVVRVEMWECQFIYL